MSVDIIVYHNSACGTSRNTIGLIRNAGIEPHVVEYLKTPPSREMLVDLVRRAGITPRALLREKGTPYAELGLADETLSDEALFDAMIDLLPAPQQGAFAKEDGEQVIDTAGQRIA
jgi:arsenate reductase